MAIINELFGNEVAQSGPPRTQVWQATHTGNIITNSKGENIYERKSYMDRSFISFSFDDPNADNPKRIEDFDFVAYTAGDRMERDAYGSFEDLTSTYDVIPGQFYWGTYFHQNSLTFNLATDGIDQVQLDAFKHWFRPGVIRELILSEHPNRAILARVAAQPRLQLLPFQKQVEMEVTSAAGTPWKTYKTSTTLYKGEVELEFVMDEPFWYAKYNVLGIPNNQYGYFDESWVDVNGTQVRISDTADALKIIYEDHIPLGSLTQMDVFYGNEIYAAVKYEPYQRICLTSEDNREGSSIEYPDFSQEWLTELNKDTSRSADEKYARYQDPKTQIYYYGARIMNNDGTASGRIGGATISTQNEPSDGISLHPVQGYDEKDSTAYLFYAGNAPSPVTIRFTLTPQFEENYIVTPWNKQSGQSKPYNTITLESTEKHEFNFTIPTLYSSYNNVITILKNPTLYAQGKSWETIRETIRDTIRHPKMRAWANLAIDKFLSVKAANASEDERQSINIISESDIENKGDLITEIKKIFMNSDTPFPATFTFDAKTGTAIGEFTIRAQSYFTENSSTIGTENLEENVGDMVKSSYIILDERNVLDGGYLVRPWQSDHKDYAYKITHNIPGGLTHLSFKFKNMYL